MVSVVAMWEQLIELRPLPRELASGEQGAPARAVPAPLPRRPGGGHHAQRRRAAAARWSIKDDAFEADLRCNFGDGRYQVEMLASDAGGPLVLANFPVFCGVQAPREIVAHEEEAEEIDPAEGEQELFALMNHDRRAAGLHPAGLGQPPGRHRPLAQPRDGQPAVRGPRLAHHRRRRRPGCGPPASAFSLVSENVGQEGGIKQAHKGFMGSPGHRANVLNPRAHPRRRRHRRRRPQRLAPLHHRAVRRPAARAGPWT